MDVQASEGRSAERPLMFQSNALGIARRLQRNRSPWTAADIDRLCELLELKRPIGEIAGLLGRTQEAVRTKAYQLDRLSARSL